MKKSEFVPGILFRLPYNKAVFKYETYLSTNLVRQVGFGEFLHRPEYLAAINLNITASTICFYTGYGTGCVLMHSDKIPFKELELVDIDSLKGTNKEASV